MSAYPRIEEWARGFETREEAEIAARSSVRGTDGTGRILPQILLTLDDVFGRGSAVTEFEEQELQRHVVEERYQKESAKVYNEMTEAVEKLRALLKREALKPAIVHLKELEMTRAVLAVRVQEAVKRGGRERTRVVAEALRKQGFVDLPSGSRVRVSKGSTVYCFMRGHAGRSRTPGWIRVVQRRLKKEEAKKRIAQ